MTTRPLTLVITAGPTREPIDPVRFLSNYSTGVLGHALVAEARRRGHRVVFVTGPTGIPPPRGVRTLTVETALEMQAVLEQEFPASDGLIMAAAVADFRPVRVAAQKIKRSGAAGGLKFWRLDLVENPDIVAGLAAQRLRLQEAAPRLSARSRRRQADAAPLVAGQPTRQVIVGLALETSRALANARAKLRAKQLDAIVLTQMTAARTPFGATSVDGAILDRRGKTTPFRRLAKPALARRILDTVERLAAPRQRSRVESSAGDHQEHPGQ